MTPKQKAFADEYLICGNATEAARRMEEAVLVLDEAEDCCDIPFHILEVNVPLINEDKTKVVFNPNKITDDLDADEIIDKIVAKIWDEKTG